MTASDHGPYYIPDYFSPASKNIKYQIVEYADWSLKKYITKAAQKPWFSNTIFVFVADHGAPLSVTYDISLDYFHTPLIFYAPGIIDSNTVFSCIGGQIDILPTLMGLLRLPYINNTLGIDLLRENRKYIMINDDDKIGILDNEFLMILKNSKNYSLYKYKTLDKTNYGNNYPEKENEMALYTKSFLQVSQDMINNDQQYIEPSYPITDKQ